MSPCARGDRALIEVQHNARRSDTDYAKALLRHDVRSKVAGQQTGENENVPHDQLAPVAVNRGAPEETLRARSGAGWEHGELNPPEG